MLYNIKMKYTLPLLCLALLLSCTGSHNDAADPETSDVAVQGDTLTIRAQAPMVSRIRTAPVTQEYIEPTVATTGVVTAIPTAYAEVAAPFAGRVQRSLVRIGQRVKAGTPLFELYSSDYSEVVKNYRQSVSELNVAKKAYDRVKNLYDNKVASAKDLEEAEAAYQLALEEHHHAQAVAREFQIDLKRAEVGQPMVVRSPIAGKVLSNDLVIGEYVKEDAEASIIVADLSKVWVKANISEKEALMMEGISDVAISLVANPDSLFRGKVIYLGEILDPETRTRQTIIECDNPRGTLLPNMYAHLQLRCTGHNYIVVPKSAVLQADAHRYVLRQLGENTYLRTPVTIAHLDDDRLIVTGGLNVNDTIITEGAFYLIDSK